MKNIGRRARGLAIVVLALAAVGCDRGQAVQPTAAQTQAAPDADAPTRGTLEWAVEGPWRSEADRARDEWRNPMQTLRFFGLRPDMRVIEVWPGSGWYTEILAPYLSEGGGTYVAAGFATGPGSDPAQAALTQAFERRFTTDRGLYGTIVMTSFGVASGPLGEPGQADMVLFMRNIHAWMASGIAEKAFADAFQALRPGGILGIEQHRLAPEEDQDPAAASGYVQEAFVRQLAEEAGFVFVKGSDINANPDDTRDHPFGVATLPPTRLTAPQGQAPDPDFDTAPYEAIGESDRMTLKFRKPE